MLLYFRCCCKGNWLSLLGVKVVGLVTQTPMFLFIDDDIETITLPESEDDSGESFDDEVSLPTPPSPRRGHRGNMYLRSLPCEVQNKALFIWEKGVPESRATLLPESPWVRQLFIRFFINRSERLHDKSQLAWGRRVTPVAGSLGWRDRVTLGAGPTFPHVNTHWLRWEGQLGIQRA